MSKQEAAKSPSWMVPYYRQTEAGACRKFWAVACEAGLQSRLDDDKVPPGWAGFRETYQPVVVLASPQGTVGRWTLQLSEQVRFLVEPDKAASGLPIVVRQSVCIESYKGDDSSPACVSTLVRPFMRVTPHDMGPPDLHLVRSSVLDRHPMSDILQMQARYITWLTLAQQNL